MDRLNSYLDKLSEAPTTPRAIPTPQRRAPSGRQQRLIFDAAADYERQQLVAEVRRELETHRGNDYPGIASADNITSSKPSGELISFDGKRLISISGKILRRIL